MTIKQTQFCQAYAIPPHNATQAAIKAGYSCHVAKTIGSKLKDNPKIQTYLKTFQTQLENKVTIDYTWKLEKLKQIVDTFIPSDNASLETKEVNSAIQAIAEMNKMQGHHAAEKHMNLNVTVDSDIEQLETLIKKYRKDY